MVPLSQVDLKHVIDEGEGDRSIAEWRANHETFWHSAEMREAMDDPEFTVDDATPTCCNGSESWPTCAEPGARLRCSPGGVGAALYRCEFGLARGQICYSGFVPERPPPLANPAGACDRRPECAATSRQTLRSQIILRPCKVRFGS